MCPSQKVKGMKHYEDRMLPALEDVALDSQITAAAVVPTEKRHLPHHRKGQKPGECSGRRGKWGGQCRRKDVPTAPFRQGVQQHFWFMMGRYQEGCGCGRDRQGAKSREGKKLYSKNAIMPFLLVQRRHKSHWHEVWVTQVSLYSGTQRLLFVLGACALPAQKPSSRKVRAASGTRCQGPHISITFYMTSCSSGNQDRGDKFSTHWLAVEPEQLPSAWKGTDAFLWSCYASAPRCSWVHYNHSLHP